MVVRQTLIGTGCFAARLIVGCGDVLRLLMGMVIVMQVLGDCRGQPRVTSQMRRARHIGHQQGAYKHAEGENPGDHGCVVAPECAAGNRR